MQLNLLYFARLRDVFGMAQETLSFDGQTVAELLVQLAQRGGDWHAELAAGRPFRVAVNQQLVQPDAELADGDEVAIFPPVTGG